ncbi:SAM-dependent DNA methyltransferase, partial [Streptococcus pneumoniae]|nr:SAM-dependent DNA methyltransferase [Streptococcus pneumoniae]
PRHIIDMMVELMQPTIKDIISDPAMGFRVIIMTQANSQVNTRVLELLPKFKIKKMNRWCAV